MTITVNTVERKRTLFGKPLESGFEHQLVNDDGQPFQLCGTREKAEKIAAELNEHYTISQDHHDAAIVANILNQ